MEILEYETEKEFILSFCDAAIEIENPNKLSRWVRFIQGVFYSQNVIDIDNERNFSRNIYKLIYEEFNMPHKTVEVKRD